MSDQQPVMSETHPVINEPHPIITEPRPVAPVREPVLFMALGVLTLTLLILGGFLLYQAIVERNTLKATKAAQDQPIQQAQQVNTQLTALATATARLAQQGNGGAKQIIDALQREGITVKP